jgi:hypothetical protein
MKRLFLTGLLMLSILVGCQAQPEQVQEEDVHEETESAANLPSFLEYYPDNIGNLYKGIPDFREVLEQLPSYGVNGEPSDLDHLYQAFVYEQQEDGSITWNDHGARCNACIDSAAYSIEAWQNGTSIEEIREMIENQYGAGTDPVTDEE